MSQGKGSPLCHRRERPQKILGCLCEEERRLAHVIVAYLACMFDVIAFNVIDPVERKQIDAGGCVDGRGGEGGNDMGYGQLLNLGALV